MSPTHKDLGLGPDPFEESSQKEPSLKTYILASKRFKFALIFAAAFVLVVALLYLLLR
jgi:hypothetical protein